MMTTYKTSFVLLLLVTCVSLADAQNSTSLSALCTSQNEALNANTAVTSNVVELECHIDTNKEDSCTVDFDSVSGNYKDACFEEGGKIYVIDLLWDCTVELFGTTYNADYTYLNYVSCVGINCTKDELDTVFSKEIHPAFEQELAVQGFTCDVSDRNEKTIEKSAASVISIRLFHSSVYGIIGLTVSVMIASVCT
jgi:hypothetical protein